MIGVKCYSRVHHRRSSEYHSRDVRHPPKRDPVRLKADKDYFDGTEDQLNDKHPVDNFFSKENSLATKTQKIEYSKEKKVDSKMKGLESLSEEEDDLKPSEEGELAYAVQESSSVIDEHNVVDRFSVKKSRKKKPKPMRVAQDRKFLSPLALRVVEEKSKSSKFKPRQFSLPRRPQALRTVQSDTNREVGNR